MIAILFILFATMMWGASFVLIKVGLREVPPVTLAALRFSLASIIFLGAVFARYNAREMFSYLRRDLWVLTAIGFSGIFLPNVLQNVGMQYTNASIASILMATGPVFVVLLAAGFLGESLGVRKIGGIVLALFGAVMISTQGDLSGLREMRGYLLGNILLLLAAASYGPSTILAKMRVSEEEPIVVLTWSTVIGSLFLLAFTPLYESGAALFSLSRSAWIIVLALVLLPTALAFFMWFEALKRMEASKVSMFIFLIPVFAVAFANFFISEPITLFTLANAALILLGVYMSQSG
ncbi:MAG: DMT family transporter [Candidatus Hydrothermarchaeaceae archaeon]